MLKGNDLSFSYVQGGKTYNIKVVRVDDSSQLPLDYTTTSGERVIGLSFAAGAAPVATRAQCAARAWHILHRVRVDAADSG